MREQLLEEFDVSEHTLDEEIRALITLLQTEGLAAPEEG